MTLLLDDRQRAMLAEMGIRLFDAPAPALMPVPHADAAPVRVAPSVSVPAVAAPAAPVTPVAPPQPVVVHAVATPAPAAAALPHALDAADWDTLSAAVVGCQACELCQGRRQAVFGVGARQADWLVVGEVPAEDEDLQGEPFVGTAGLLLDNMLRALGLDRRDSVFLTHVLKCRPPGNRIPTPAELATCEPFLRRQVALVKPKVILATGRFAVQSLLGSTEPLGRLRGQVHHYQGVPVVVTFHPAYLLRNLPDKARAWADLCLAREQVEAST